MKTPALSRRSFLKSSSAALVLAALAPRVFAAGREPKLRIAAVGCGGQFGGDAPALAAHPRAMFAAVCDVDKNLLRAAGERFQVPESARFTDYREMLRVMWGDLDAVYCATPDHMHAPVGLSAMAHGLHVYVQKPLARSVGECRAFRRAAEKLPHLATQMGIQIHAESAYRTAVKWIADGLIGKVKEVHSACGKGWGGLQPAHAPDPVPAHLDWDLYCGASEGRPFVDGYYHPGNWRRSRAFGTGTLGDMACHILDPVFSALDWKDPLSVVSHLDAPPGDDAFPYDGHIEWRFAANARTAGETSLHWYHGNAVAPDQVAKLPDGSRAPHSGSIFIGEKGILVLPHWAMPTVFGADGKKLGALPDPVPDGNHYFEWIDAALGATDKRPGAHLEYAGALSETVLMGNIASWWPKTTIPWNARAGRFGGELAARADALLLPHYRDRWAVPFLNE